MHARLAVGSCDKNAPGALMAMARLNIPSLFLYGGSIQTGLHRGKVVNAQDVMKGVGAYYWGQVALDDLREMERVVRPGERACPGMFTPNSMAAAANALGMALPRSASVLAVDSRTTWTWPGGRAPPCTARWGRASGPHDRGNDGLPASPLGADGVGASCGVKSGPPQAANGS